MGLVFICHRAETALKYLKQLGWLPRTFKFCENGLKLLRLEAVTSETGTPKWKERLKEELRS